MSRLRVGIDAVEAVGAGGISTYARNLIEQLIRADSQDCFYLFSYLHEIGRTQFPSLKGARNWHEVRTHLLRTLLPVSRLGDINDASVRIAARLHRLDLVHFTNPLNMTAVASKTVVTVHDLAPLHNPMWIKEGSRRLFEQKLPAIVAADAIIAVSWYTKDDVVRRLGVDPAKITVVYEGASADFFPDTGSAAVAALVGAGRYVLCVGEIQPRKNIPTLIAAFGAIANSFPDVQLVIVGRARNAFERQRIVSSINDSGLANRVSMLGYVDTDMLRKLYSGAWCVVYPSLLEGFGLPVLEALACGAPVVVADSSSLPEVAGNAGMVFDPHSVTALAEVLRRVLGDAALRSRLAAEALPQAARFSWQQAAHETLAVYQRIV